jgi:hypothetical protein
VGRDEEDEEYPEEDYPWRPPVGAPAP